MLRHGESQWNVENRFTVWTDVDLTKKVFAEMLDSPLRVILEITPEKWITYDGEKAGRHFAGTIDEDELGPMLSSDSDRMEKYRTKRAEEGLTH